MKVIIEMKEIPVTDKETVNNLFEGLKRAYLSDCMEGTFPCGSEIIKWRIED